MHVGMKMMNNNFKNSPFLSGKYKTFDITYKMFNSIERININTTMSY